MRATAVEMADRRRRILIADDLQDTIDFLRLWLLAEGHSVYGLTDLTKVDEVLVNQNIEVLLLDLLFPDSDASNEIPRLRSKFPDLRIIVMSGTPDRSTTVRAISAGADGYLTKPIEKGELVALLDNMRVD